jgi:tellurite resistance protein TerC
VTWAAWGLFLLLVAALLVLDVVIPHRRRMNQSVSTALLYCLIPVGMALFFGLWLHYAYERHWFGLSGAGNNVLGPSSSAPLLEYTTGYLLELGLSADNIMMFLLLMHTFDVPRESQGFVIFWAILGALVLRVVLILSGLALIVHIPVVFYFLGAFLIAAGILMFLRDKGERKLGAIISRIISRWVPLRQTFDGNRLFVIHEGRHYATPLLLVMLLIAITDLAFALDSIPAIFGITEDPMIVVTSNVFAVLALHWLYFVLAPLMQRLKFMKIGLAIILIFIGVKMVLPGFSRLSGGAWPRITVPWSLAFIAVVLGMSIAASLLSRNKNGGQESPTMN